MQAWKLTIVRFSTYEGNIDYQFPNTQIIEHHRKMPSPASSDNNKYNDVCNLSLVHTQLTAVLEEPQLSIPSYILAYHEFHKYSFLS